MSCSTREFGKCVKTQLQLVCSNYDSREFISISLLIKRDFLIWINTAHKGVFEWLEAGLCRGRMPMGCWRYSRSGAALGSSPILWASGAGPGLGNLPGRSRRLCQVSCGQQEPGRWFWTGSSIKNNQTNNKPQTTKTLEGTTRGAKTETWPKSFALVKVKEHKQSEAPAWPLQRSPSGCWVSVPLSQGICSAFCALSCRVAWSCSSFAEQEKIVVLTGEQLGKG